MFSGTIGYEFYTAKQDLWVYEVCSTYHNETLDAVIDCYGCAQGYWFDDEECIACAGSPNRIPRMASAVLTGIRCMFENEGGAVGEKWRAMLEILGIQNRPGSIGHGQ